MNAEQLFEQQVEKNYRFNFTVNLLDGTFFWFGNSFMAAAVILPLYVSHFTDSKLLIGLIAVITSAGFYLPQIFTANWVEHLPLKKVLPVKVGLFTERLPVVLLVPSAAWFATRSPQLALVLFFIMLAWHTVGAGIISVGWQDMLAKVFPVDRRGRFMGLTNFMGTVTGILGAATAAFLLGRFAFPTGFVICFAIAAACTLISWGFLALTREPALVTNHTPTSQQTYWRNLPRVLKKDPNFQRFLTSQAVINLGGMAWGFLAVYAMQRWNLSDSQVGSYTPALLVGQAAANLLFGWLADRKGYKLVIELGTLAAILSILAAMFAPNPNWFYLVFALRGVSFAGVLLSMLIAFEFSPPDVRPTYIGLNNTTAGISLGLAPMIGGSLATVAGYPALFLASLVVTALGLFLLYFTVQEPRRQSRQAIQPAVIQNG